MGLVFLIPAYKPTIGLLGLLTDLRKLSAEPIVIVDDGSGPDFADIFAACQKVPGVLVLQNALNLGKGAALKHGLNRALIEFPGAEAFVTADADGQHLPADIMAVARSSSPDSLTLGVRTFDSTVPPKSRFGNTVSKYTYRLAAGIRLSDTQTGLRSIPRRLAEHCLSIRSNRYEFETEQLVVAKREGFLFREVPIATVYIDDNRGTHFDPLLDSFRIYFVLLRYAASSIATAIVDLIVFLALTSVGAGITTANIGARAVALGVQFYLLKTFVFRVKAGPLRFVLFVLYVGVMGLVSAALQIQLSSAAGLGTTPSKVVVETAIWVFNFLFLRDFFFTRPK